MIHTNSKPNQCHRTWESHDGLERPTNSSNPRQTWKIHNPRPTPNLRKPQPTTHDPRQTWGTHEPWWSHDPQRRWEEQLVLVRWLAVAYCGGLWRLVRPWWLGDGLHVHHGFGSKEERANKREEDKRGKWNNEKGRERIISQIIK